MTSESWRARWETFVSASRPAWRPFPELLEAGLTLVRPAHRDDPTGLFPSLKGLLSFLAPRGPAAPAIPRCDYVLCYHSVAENVKRPMLELASRLSARGYRVLVWSYEGAWIQDGEGKRAIAVDTGRWIFQPLLRGLAATCALALLCAARKGPSGLFRNPFRVWLALAKSSRRLLNASRLCRELRPRAVVLTNERYSPGADLALSGAARSVLYLHGNPTSFEFPLVSDEVMVWNQSAADWLIRYSGEARPLVHVCGNSELDLVLAAPIPPAPQASGPEFLFLSQCVDRDFPEAWACSAEALEWIRYAAERHPSWTFLLKERHYDDGIRRLAALSGLDRLPNVAILPGSESYAGLLARERVKVVAAFSSTGLFVAAGAGKRAMRLAITSEEVSVVDDIAVKVIDRSELTGFLDDLKPPVVPDAHFPFRGGAMGRMEEVIVAVDNAKSAA